MSSNTIRPYAVIGSGQLRSQVWKNETATSTTYQFNIFRQDESGQVDHRFGPDHIVQLIKLAQVIAMMLADGDGMCSSHRTLMEEWADRLDVITSEYDESQRDLGGE